MDIIQTENTQPTNTADQNKQALHPPAQVYDCKKKAEAHNKMQNSQEDLSDSLKKNWLLVVMMLAVTVGMGLLGRYLTALVVP